MDGVPAITGMFQERRFLPGLNHLPIPKAGRMGFFRSDPKRRVAGCAPYRGMKQAMLAWVQAIVLEVDAKPIEMHRVGLNGCQLKREGVELADRQCGPDCPSSISGAQFDHGVGAAGRGHRLE